MITSVIDVSGLDQVISSQNGKKSQWEFPRAVYLDHYYLIYV